jgi:putative chitinase
MSTSTSQHQATLILRAPRGKAATDAHDTAATAPAPTAPAEHPLAPVQASAGRVVELVTLAQLRAVMTRLASAKASAYINPLNQAMGEFLINNRLREAAFLGQVAHESGELAWFHEFASGNEYDLSVNPRLAKQLGNVNPGDGPRYKGRGPIQITGRANYRACGRALGLDLEGNPDIAVQPGVAFRTAGWFWSTHGLNALADQQDYRTITRRINGGYNGYDDRLKYYERALQVLPATPHT